jgi:hypothetical protein
MTRARAANLSPTTLVASARRFDGPRFREAIRTVVTAAIEGRPIPERRPEAAEPGIATAPVPGRW